MKTESQHTMDVMRSLGKAGWKCRKLPGGRFASGLPDAVIAKDGVAAMIEFKRPKTKGPSTAGLTAQQKSELVEWAAAGVRSYVAVITDSEQGVTCTLMRVRPDGTIVLVEVVERKVRLDWEDVGLVILDDSY